MVESLSYILQGLFKIDKNEYQTENCMHSQLTKSNGATVCCINKELNSETLVMLEEVNTI